MTKVAPLYSTIRTPIGQELFVTDNTNGILTVQNLNAAKPQYDCNGNYIVAPGTYFIYSGQYEVIAGAVEY